jgi:hypothetical protein
LVVDHLRLVGIHPITKHFDVIPNQLRRSVQMPSQFTDCPRLLLQQTDDGLLCFGDHCLIIWPEVPQGGEHDAREAELE